MTQTLIIAGTVLAAVAYLVRRVVKQMTSKKAGCGCGSESCPQAAGQSTQVTGDARPESS